MRKPKGLRADSRSLLRRKPRERGKIGLSTILHEYKPGEKIVIELNPSIHKGMPHRRYQGKVGDIVGRRGRAYAVNIAEGNVIKKILVLPEHLKPQIGE